MYGFIFNFNYNLFRMTFHLILDMTITFANRIQKFKKIIIVSTTNEFVHKNIKTLARKYSFRLSTKNV